jgi:hypothetical protein
VNALGEWGYWGLGSGGTGGIWTPVTFSPSSWANAGPGVGYDPDGRLTYVDAVRAIAETDRDGLSSSPQTLSRFLRSGMTSGALLELGFEIARSNSTVMLGENPMSEWIETLIGATDTGWKDKGCDR